MAELTPQERLQPSLLDRLTDNAPEKTQESRNERVLSINKIREGVLRDLAWLLNTGNLAEVEDLSKYPHVANSVLNYGMPGLTGFSLSNLNINQVERLLRQAIIDYEPRILKNTVKVRVVVDEDQMNTTAVQFEIEGELWAQPVPLHLFMKTKIDLETGNVTVTDSSGKIAK